MVDITQDFIKEVDTAIEYLDIAKEDIIQEHFIKVDIILEDIVVEVGTELVGIMEDIIQDWCKS